MKDLISIIVPVYNSELYIRDTIASLISQTYRNLEIIIVNDGSPDMSGTIADDFSKEDNRIKVIHQENQGAASALNVGVSNSTGDYIMFLDGDDWYDLQCCEYAYNALKRYNVDLVFWPFIKEFNNYSKLENHIFNKDSLFEGENMVWLKRRIVGLCEEELSNPTRTDAINSGWGKLYKSNLIRNKVLWTDTAKVGSSDVLFNIEVFQNVNSAYYLHKFYTHYRKDNPNSLTKNYNTSLFPKYIRLFKEIENLISLNKLPEEYEVALKNRVCVSVINHVLNITYKKNDLSFNAKYKYLQMVLNNPIYKKSFKNFKLHYFNFHWKIFFMACKYRLTGIVYLMSYGMRWLKK